MSVENLLARLQGVQGRGPRWRATCPAHESKHGTRSLAIFEPDPDRILLHCHAGCEPDAIVGALGMELSDLFPSQISDDKRPPKICKPWRASDLIAALRGELLVAWIVLGDVAAGRPLGDADRKRAGVALGRIQHYISELENAS